MSDYDTEYYNNEWINDGRNRIHKDAKIFPNVKLGKGNQIGPFAVIGSNGEIRDVDQTKFKGWVQIGDNNVISELVTIQRPYEAEATIIGNDNILMAHSHIGHNAKICNNVEICTGAIIGGYAVINNDAKIKLGVTVRNRVIVGKGSLVGFQSAVAKNVPENDVQVGVPAKSIKK